MRASVDTCTACGAHKLTADRSLIALQRAGSEAKLRAIATVGCLLLIVVPIGSCWGISSLIDSRKARSLQSTRDSVAALRAAAESVQAREFAPLTVDSMSRLSRKAFQEVYERARSAPASRARDEFLSRYDPAMKYRPPQTAYQVLAAARSLCSIRVEEPHVVVECFRDIAPKDQLGFARAIADADATITGEARNIYFYLPGNVLFATADRLSGVSLSR